MRNLIRKILKEEFFKEEAKRFNALPETTCLFIEKVNVGYTLSLYDPISKNIYAVITFNYVKSESPFYDVSGVAAEKGFGPFIYELAMMFLSKKNKMLMPARDGDVRGDAWSVWEKFYNRNDVNKETIDLLDDNFRCDILTGDECYFDDDEDKQNWFNQLGDYEKNALIVFNTGYSINQSSDFYKLIKNSKTYSKKVFDDAIKYGSELWYEKYINENFKNESLLFEEQKKMILYHGTPFSFKEFKDKMTFFSDNPMFAYDYASQKSMDMVLDADIKTITVQVNANLFNIFNKIEYKQLAETLPNEIEVMPPKFSFMTYNLSKEELLLRMKGKKTSEPIEEIVSKNIGDIFKFNGGNNIIIDKNNKYVRAMYMPYYSGYMSCAISSDEWEDCKAYNNKDIRKYFENYREFKLKQAEEAYGKTYLSESQIVWFWSSYSKEEDGGPSKEMREHLKKLYDEAAEKTVKYYNDNNFGETYNINKEIIKIDDTWTFFENPTVIETLIELGYGGYIAREDNHNTYAIFNPKKDVKILKIEK